MKKDIVEYLGFDDDDNKKRKVGRPKLADAKTKKKSLIIASLSLFAVILLMIFGYGTLFGFKNLRLLGALTENNATDEEVLVSEIKPLISNITLKAGTSRKVYLTILPAKATNKEITYESSDEKVAIVDKDGVVTGNTEGNATIYAKTQDGSEKQTEFKVTVIKNADGYCEFSNLSKQTDKVDYEIECSNAKIKEVQYKVGNEKYEKLLSNKMYGTVNFSQSQLKNKITFKVVYYPNDSKVSKYQTKTLNVVTKTTKEPSGSCEITFDDIKKNSLKYDITCDNAHVSKIAYKIGNGSYIGIDSGILADTILFDESNVTRVIYFNVDYLVNGSNRTKTITKSGVIVNANTENE